ncbi:MAG: hypothetical protein AB7S38_27030 [Vulcanimicrobiota bacterium]
MLAVTPFEKLFLYCDEVAGPTAFEIGLEFTADFDHQKLTAALDRAVTRHPMLSARIEEHRGRLVWVPQPEYHVPLLPPATGNLLSPLHGGGVRVRLSDLGPGTRLLFEIHHSCCDGRGAFLFLDDFLQDYHELCGGAARRRPKRDLSVLERRGQVEVSETSLELSLWLRLRLAWDFLSTRPQGFGDVKRPARSHRPFSQQLFSPALSSLIDSRLAGSGANLNDLGLALLLRTLASTSSSSQPLRLLVPTSLRRLSDFRAGASHRTSFAFLTRAPHDCLGGFADLLEWTVGETRFIKAARPDYTTVLGVNLLERLRLLRRFLSWPQARNTAVLSFMDDVTRLLSLKRFPSSAQGVGIGDQVLSGVFGVPPTRPGTSLSFGLGRFQGRVNVCLKGEPQVVSEQLEAQLMAAYTKGWQAWAEGAL